MKYEPDKHHRRSIRLRGFDYGQTGVYFLTIFTRNRECLFGEIVDGEMQVNEAGEVAQAAWLGLPARFSSITLDAFVTMPNHIHGIISIARAGPTLLDLSGSFVSKGLSDQGAASSALRLAILSGYLNRFRRSR